VILNFTASELSALDQCYISIRLLPVSGTCSQIRYWLNLQIGKWQPGPSAWAEPPGPCVARLGSTGWGRRESLAGVAGGGGRS